jgi:hypothetical protein
MPGMLGACGLTVRGSSLEARQGCLPHSSALARSIRGVLRLSTERKPAIDSARCAIGARFPRDHGMGTAIGSQPFEAAQPQARGGTGGEFREFPSHREP